MMNNWNGIGRLTKDSELRYSQNGKAFLKGTIAIQRRFNKEEADFIRFTIFNQGAEIFAQYTKKGSQVGLEGRIQTDKYDDKDGKTVFTTDIIVENFTFLDSKADKQNANTSNQSNQQQGNQNQGGWSAPTGDQSQGEPLNIQEQDLPF